MTYIEKVIQTLKEQNRTIYWLAKEASIQRQNLYAFLHGKKQRLSEKAIAKINNVLVQFDETFGYKRFSLIYEDKRLEFDHLEELVKFCQDKKIIGGLLNEDNLSVGTIASDELSIEIRIWQKQGLISPVYEFKTSTKPSNYVK